jgi:hypothetical protein
MVKKVIGSRGLGCWSYYKTAGEGWEVGFCFHNEPLFVGNFLHKAEALQWFRLMNREVLGFARKYPIGPKFPVGFVKDFVTNHLYVTYYSFLDRLFVRHTRDYKRAAVRDLKKYASLKRHVVPAHRTPFIKAA